MRNHTGLRADAEEVFLEALITGDPSRAIENQEKRGQAQVVASGNLPQRLNESMSWETLCESWGMKVLGPDGDLFFKVELPAGWKIERTDHSMWTKLVDDKGRERASIFYKAAFYDRDAFFSLSRRYQVKTAYVMLKDGVVSDPKNEHANCRIITAHDYATGETLREFGRVIYDDPDVFDREKHKLEDGLRIEASDWLDGQFPDRKNPLAYWNEPKEDA